MSEQQNQNEASGVASELNDGLEGQLQRRKDDFASTSTKTLISAIRARMEIITAFERIELVAAIMDGYCKECGFEDPNKRCQCWNDE